MVHPSIYALLQEANRELASAETELSRPYEDVVSYFVCQLTKSSIHKLFASFLGYNYSLTETGDNQIEDHLNKLMMEGLTPLIKSCKKADQAFGQLDYAALDCKKLTTVAEQNSYCIAEENVEECAKLGRKIEKLIYEIITKNENGKILVRRPSEIN